jgi:hypothetical protein
MPPPQTIANDLRYFAFAAAAWTMFAAGLLAIGLCCWDLRLPENAFSRAYCGTFQSLLLIVGFVGITPIFLLGRKGQSLRAWTVTIRQGLFFTTWVAFLLGLSVSAERYLPFRIGFRASRHSMDRFADATIARIGPGRASEIRQQVGPFHFKSAAATNRSLILELSVVNENAEYGFVRMCVQAQDWPTDKDLGLSGARASRVLVERIADNWFVYYDLYEYAKDGWS